MPLVVPLLALMGAGPLLAWKRGDLSGVISRLRLAAAVAIGAAAVIWFAHERHTFLATLGITLSVWIAAGTVTELALRLRLFQAPIRDSVSRARHLPLAAYGMTVSHLGVAVIVAGITASSAWQTEKILSMKPGDIADIAGYAFAFEGIAPANGPNYRAERGTFIVKRGDRIVATLFPERRFYSVEGRQTTEAAIHTTWFADLYAVIGDSTGAGSVNVRLYHNPLVPWIWTGAIVMALGGALSLCDRRHRVGAPVRATARAAA